MKNTTKNTKSIQTAELIKDTSSEFGDARLVVNGRYLPSFDLTNFPICALQSPMGTGKTEAIINTLLLLGIEKILLISPRLSLIEAMIKRFAILGINLVDYRTKIAGSTKQLISCCNSVSKLPYDDEQLSEFTVIIDESEQVFSQLANMKKLGQTLESDYDYLCRVIQNSWAVVAADANMSDLTMDILNEYRAGRAILTVNSTHLPGAGRQVTIWKEKALLLKDVHASLENGERVLFVSDSIGLVEQFHCTAKAAGYNGIAITGDSKNDPLEKEFVTDVNKEILKYQYVAYSPAISSGVSIDDVDGLQLRVFGFFSPSSGPTTEDAWQQLGRYRGLCNYDIFIENRTDNKPVTVDECLKEIETKAFAKIASITENDVAELQQIVNANAAATDATGTGIGLVIAAIQQFLIDKLATPYALLQARVTAKANSLCNNFLNSFKELAERQGYTVVFKEAMDKEELKTARKTAKANKQAADTEYVATIVNAYEINKVEAIRIEADDNAKSYDVQSLERFKLNEFYGGVTPEIVAADKRGELRSKIRRVLKLANPDGESRRDVNDIIDLFNGKVSIGHLKAHRLFCNVYKDMLGWAGYVITDGQVNHDGRTVTADSLRQGGFVPWVKSQRQYLKIFHALPKDLEKKPVGYLQAFLTDLGLELAGKRSGKRLKLKYTYSAQSEKIGLINQFLAEKPWEATRQ